jgi:hypothetical protein
MPLLDVALEAQRQGGMDEWAVESGLAPKGNSDPADQSSLEGGGLAIALTRWRTETWPYLHV